MKTKMTMVVFFLSMTLTISYAQEKSKRQLRKERSVEKQNEITSLIDSKKFVFIGRTAFPQGFRTIDLTTNQNYVKFEGDTIKSAMPFFGRGYSGIGYGNDGGLNFEGKPKKFTIEKNKKGYEINAVVKGMNDEFRLFLTVSMEGYATLIINSNNRSPITYYGEISAPEK